MIIFPPSRHASKALVIKFESICFISPSKPEISQTGVDAPVNIQPFIFELAFVDCQYIVDDCRIRLV